MVEYVQFGQLPFFLGRNTFMLEDTISSWVAAHVPVVEAETPLGFLSMDINEILRVLVLYLGLGSK